MQIKNPSAVRNQTEQAELATAKAHFPIQKNQKNYGTNDSHRHTTGSSLMLWSSGSVLGFSFCDLWKETGALVEIYVCNERNQKPTNENFLLDCLIIGTI